MGKRAGPTPEVMVLGWERLFHSFPLCFLPRPWGGQSCPDLAQGQGSTSDVSLKVGEDL